MPGIHVRGLLFQYDGLAVLENITFDVAPGEIVSLVGPSGCGKTTLLRCVAGLLTPTAGNLEIEEHRSHRERHCAFVFQRPALLPWLTVSENLTLPFRLQGQPIPNDKLNAQLADLQLDGFAHAFPTELSVGMAQRVALARALTEGRPTILLDEPYSALDELNRRMLAMSLSDAVAKKQIAALIVTHSIHDAVYLSNRVYVLSPRPARIVHRIDVPFKHPRGNGLWYGEQLLPFMAEARASLEAEQ